MLFLVWTSVCSDNKKSGLALKKFKGITKASACVISKHITPQISQKLRTQWTTFCFKHKTQPARRKQMSQIKKKKAAKFWKKILLSKTFFTTVLTIAREMPKGKILTRSVS